MAKTNAAKELLALLDEWGRADGTIADRRSGVGNMNEEVLDATMRATRLLLQVEEYLDATDQREDSRELVNSLRLAIWPIGSDWELHAWEFSRTDRTALYWLSKTMDTAPVAVPLLSEEEVAALRSALHQCLDLIEAQTEPVKEQMRHVTYLIRRCLDLVSGAEVDFVALQRLTFEMTGAAVPAASALPENARSRFASAVRDAVQVWVPPIITGTAGDLAAGAIRGLLEG